MPTKSKGRVGPSRNIKSDVKRGPYAKGGYMGSGSVDNSYRDSPSKPGSFGRPTDSRGFHRDPKEGKAKLTSPAFPDNYDSQGTQPGVKGDGGMAHRQDVGGSKYPTYDYGK